MRSSNCSAAANVITSFPVASKDCKMDRRVSGLGFMVQDLRAPKAQTQTANPETSKANPQKPRPNPRAQP